MSTRSLTPRSWPLHDDFSVLHEERTVDGLVTALAEIADHVEVGGRFILDAEVGLSYSTEMSTIVRLVSPQLQAQCRAVHKRSVASPG